MRKVTLPFVLTLFLILNSCGGTDEPTEEPNQAPNKTTATINVDDTTNRVSIDVSGTDPNSEDTLTFYAELGSTNNASLKKNLNLNSNGEFDQVITNQGIYNYVDHWSTDNNGASSEKVRKTINLTVEVPNVAPTARVTFNDFGEHTPIGTIVGKVDSADANGDSITTTIEEGGSEFELVLQAGQTNKYDIKTKVVFDYETAGDNTHNIKVKVADATLSNEVNANANETDEDDVISQNSLDSPQSVYSSITIDVADNDPNANNEIEYEADKDGNSTGRTIEQMNTDLAANTWPAGQGGNYSGALGAIMAVIKDNPTSDQKVLTESATGGLENGGVIHRASFVDVDGTNQPAADFDKVRHVRVLEEIRKIYASNGVNIPHADAWSVGASVATALEKKFTLSNYLTGDQVARADSSVNLNESSAQIARKVVNTILNMTDTEISNMLDQYVSQGYATMNISN